MNLPSTPPIRQTLEELRRLPLLVPARFPSADGLEEALLRLSQQEASRPAGLSEDILHEAAERALELLRGEGMPLSPREQRRLSWALDHGRTIPLSHTRSFPLALGLLGVSLRPSMVMGLVRGFWETTCPNPPNMEAWGGRIRTALGDVAASADPELRHWAERRELLFGQGRFEKLSAWLLTQQDLVAALRELAPPSWRGHLQIGHRMVREVLLAACSSLPSRGDGEFGTRLEAIIDLIEQVQAAAIAARVRPDAWLKEPIEVLLVSLAAGWTGEAHARLLHVCMELFDDPRLSRNVRWTGVDERARDLIVQWLAQHDIELFFKALAMDNERREFWLQYVRQMTYTRLVLGPRVRVDPSVDAEVRKALKENRHAEMVGAQDLAAIICEVRGVTFVEFSRKPNAAYWYEGDVPFSLERRSYRADDLKHPCYHPRFVSENRIIHNPPGAWQHKAKRLLYQLGIRTDENNGFYTPTGASPYQERPPAPRPSAARSFLDSVAASPTPGPIDSRSLDSRLIPLAPPSEDPPSRTRPRDWSPEIIPRLEAEGCEFVDLRDRGGCLWILSPTPTGACLEWLRQEGYAVRFIGTGGKATANRPAFYVRLP